MIYKPTKHFNFYNENTSDVENKFTVVGLKHNPNKDAESIMVKDGFMYVVDESYSTDFLRLHSIDGGLEKVYTKIVFSTGGWLSNSPSLTNVVPFEKRKPSKSE